MKKVYNSGGHLGMLSTEDDSTHAKNVVNVLVHISTFIISNDLSLSFVTAWYTNVKSVVA
jgi:hypothetical protein